MSEEHLTAFIAPACKDGIFFLAEDEGHQIFGCREIECEEDH
jgi:hypothetical protein